MKYVLNNIVINGDFENLVNPQWEYSLTGEAISSESETITNHFARIKSTESIYQKLGDVFKQNDTGTISLKLRGQTGLVVAIFRDENKVVWSGNLTPTGVTEWDVFSLDFNLDATNYTNLYIHLQAQYNSNGDAYVDIDDVVLVID